VESRRHGLRLLLSGIPVEVMPQDAPIALYGYGQNNKEAGQQTHPSTCLQYQIVSLHYLTTD
jgi:hypothetical protein